MNSAIRRGFSFGLASGVITTLGLVVGLNSSTHSKMVVLGGILVIAVADALSDAVGIHVSVESEKRSSSRSIWESTVAAFLTKFLIALTFVVPILLLPLYSAIIASIVWGLALIAVFSYTMSLKNKFGPVKATIEHLAIAVVVIIVTHYLGLWVSTLA